MNRPADPAQHLLLLAGGGHSHAVLLLRWLMRPRLRPSRTRVMLVNRHSTALYSGMVPAVAAGLLPAERACIDLRWLCRRARGDFVQAEITGLDPATGELWLAGRPPLRFDRLSLDVGAITPPPAGAAEQPVKPLDRFLQWVAERGAEPVRIRGGGAAAVELALALE